MEACTKYYQTSKGMIEGIHVKWTGFSLILATGSKGFLACGVFDLDAIDAFGRAAAIVQSMPDNPIGNLDRLPMRKIAKVNSKAKALGIEPGMDVTKAFELIV